MRRSLVRLAPTSARLRRGSLRLFLGGLVAAAALILPNPADAAPFTAGNLVVYRVGDGAAALASNATAVFLDEYTTAGVLVQSIAMPIAAAGPNLALTASGTATTEGFLSRSQDGVYLVVPGYDAAPGTAGVTTSTTIARVMGRVDSSAAINTTSSYVDATTSGNIRSTASLDGSRFWASGSTQGVRTVALGGSGAATLVSTTATNLRQIGIFGSQLYIGSGAGTIRMGTVGSGTPITTGNTMTALPGFPTAAPTAVNGYLFADLDAGVAGVDTLYVADEGNNVISKWCLVSGTWTARGTVVLTTARGLTGTVSGSTVALYATGGAAGTPVVTITDSSGYNANLTGAVTTIVATAGTNRAFRGIVMAPAGVVLPNLTVNDVSLNEGNAGTTSFTFTVSLSAPAGPGGVTFDIATADGTAQDDNPVAEDNDYVAKSLAAQTIPAGSSTYSFTVDVNGDTTPETNETFFVNVTNVVGATVTDGQGQGTIVNDDAAPNLTVNDVSLNEGNAGTTTFTFTVSLSAPAGAGGVTFDIATADGTAQDDNPVTEDNDYVPKSLTGQTIPAGSSTYTFDVLVNGDVTPETNETFFVNVTNIVNAIGADSQGQGTIVNDDITLIHDVQGSGAATPIPGATVTVEGVVVANFQGTGRLQGFFLEEEDIDFDANPATSEGIFIFCSSCPTPVAEGQRVRATGVVSEFNNMTEITASTAGSVVITNAGNNLAQVTPSPIDLPVVGVVNDFYETKEGMLVTFVDTLTVSEYFEMARFGHLVLYEGGRPRQFTEANPPSVAGLTAHNDNLSRREVILDDDNNRQNAFLPAFGGPADGLQAIFHPRANGGLSVGTQGADFFRGGDLVNGLTGVLHWSFPGTGPDTWRIRPTAATPATFTVANPRPPVTQPAVGGAIKAAAMNLLNYFTTIDTTASTSTGPCAPSGTLDCRGADSVAELNRQRERATVVICALNADVYGFVELENTTASATITDLLGAVNTLCGGAHPYTFANTGGTLGTDAIRVQQIYRTGILSPVGAPLSDLDPVHNRPPTAQTYDVVDATNPAFGQRFTVIANHFKSKGCPGTGGDADLGDGQGCFNATRTAQATRLLTWITSTVLPAAGDPDVLLLGDFNSYAQENPVTTITAGGYTDLETALLGPNAYSYLFDGQLGHLDYAFASSSLTPRITGVAPWHINADEIPVFDYNDEVFDSPGEANFEEEPDGSALVPPRVVFQPASPYRASDHDPVLVGIFAVADASITKTDGVTTAVPGGSVTYTITASNAGPDPITGGTVADTFPAALTCTWTCVGAGGGTCTAAGSGNISDTVNMPVGGSVTYTASCTISPSATGTLANTATVSTGSGASDPNTANNSATDSDILGAQADLAVTKTDGVTTATAGGSVTYTITASNAGPSSAAGATVADTFPASLTCTWTCVGAGGGTCTAAGSGNINDTVNLPAGGSVTYTASCTISAAATGTLSNTATVAAPGGVTDPSPANNSATDSDSLGQSADVSITKTDGVTAATPGGSVTYTIVASNAGPSNATGGTVADTFPASLTCTWTCVGAAGGTCTAAGSGNINDTVNLPAGGSVTYTASCTINAAATGTLSNTATVAAPGGVTDPAPANNSATDTDSLGASADVSITKTDGVTTATPGGSVTYTITASNSGPSDAPFTSIADTFPAALTCTWTCVGAGGGTCTAAGSGNIAENSVNLPVGGSVTYTASCTISPSATGTLSNTATVTACGDIPRHVEGCSVNDPNQGNNSATDTDTLGASADVSITKTDGVTTVTAGGTLTYTITASNAGPSDASGATVADTFPASLACTWTCAGAGGGTCTAAGSGNISDTVNLPNGGSVTYTASCTVSPSATGTIVNTATAAVPAGVTDPTPGNNSATDTDTVQAPPGANVTGTKTVSGTFTPGGTITYTVTLTNSGTTAQGDNPGNEFVDVLPPSLALVSATATSGAAVATVATNTVTWNGSLAASGGSVTITITATILPTASGSVSNQGTIAYDSDDNGTNESTRQTDDPAVGGQTDPTVFVLGGGVLAIPALDWRGLLVLAALLGLAGAALLRRR